MIHAFGDKLEILACPVHGTPLTDDEAILRCVTCGEVGCLRGPVLRFLYTKDLFYEGKYHNRTSFLPKGDGFLATLPLRVVLQGYPTTVSRAVPKGATVVDLGCAGGVAWFAQRYRMLGLDISYSALPTAASDYWLTLQADATRMPLRSATVDAVISSCFFEHFDESGKLALLAECARVLKPGGKIVFFYDIWTDNPVISTYRNRDPRLYSEQFLEGDGHIGYAGLEENNRLFTRSGFVIDRQTFHERTPWLGNSVWQKLSQWPGLWGIAARAGHLSSTGVLRLPSLAAITLVDATVGRLMPKRYARCVTTVAVKG